MSTSTTEPVMASEASGYQDVAGPGHWDAFWSQSQVQTYTEPPLWHDVVSRYLPRRNDWTVFEIGCVPGRLLVYFHKEFGYIPSGIDYVSKLDLVRANLQHNDVPVGDFFPCDLFKFEPRVLYDVVFSNGFIEHFEDYDEVIAKHAACVKPGGYLVLVVPNYTHLQYFMRLVFDAENLAKHRFEVMRPAILKRSVESAGMIVEHCDMAVTFDFWIVQRGTGWRRRCTWLAEGIAGRIQVGLAKLGLGNVPNRFLSPFVVCIARKPGDGGG